MKLRTKRAMNTTMLAAAICLTAFRANAERITFDLPVRAHWGTAILQPGKYTFEIPLASSWPQQISLTQNGGTVRIFPTTEAAGVESNRSYLRLVAVGDTYFVTEYTSGSTGKQFTFQIPKKSLHSLSAKAPEKKLEVGGDLGS